MFMLSRMLVGNTPPIVYMQPTDSESYQVGEALKLASGKVTLCSGAAAPSHVCVGPIDDNGVVPCVEVQKYMEFETTLGVAPRTPRPSAWATRSPCTPTVCRSPPPRPAVWQRSPASTARPSVPV